VSSLCAAKLDMPRDLWRQVRRVVSYGVGVAALSVTVGFGWFVLISWDVLKAALGTTRLTAVLTFAAATVGAWGSALLRRRRHPATPLGRRARAGLGALSLLALVCCVVVVPATRAGLETNKCRRLAPADPAAQARCLDWLEGRRQWWTLGLSHKNG